MKLPRLKQGLVGMACALSMIVSVGAMLSPTVEASTIDQHQYQDRGRERDRDRDREHNRYVERGREGYRDRDRERHRYIETHPYYRNNPVHPYGYNNGYNYNNGYGYNNTYNYNNGDVQRGYQDGLNRGREDAQTHRSPDPNHSDHYRAGDAAYQQGFARGYAQSFRQYSGYGR